MNWVSDATDARAKWQMRSTDVETLGLWNSNSILGPQSGRKVWKLGSLLNHKQDRYFHSHPMGRTEDRSEINYKLFKKQWPLFNCFRDVLKVIYEDYKYTVNKSVQL